MVAYDCRAALRQSEFGADKQPGKHPGWKVIAIATEYGQYLNLHLNDVEGK